MGSIERLRLLVSVRPACRLRGRGILHYHPPSLARLRSAHVLGLSPPRRAQRSRFNTAAGVVGGASAILGKVFGGASTAAPTAAEADEPRAVAALVSFQQQMRDLQSLLTDGDASEFIIVSIPTYLSLTGKADSFRRLRLTYVLPHLLTYLVFTHLLTY